MVDLNKELYAAMHEVEEECDTFIDLANDSFKPPEVPYMQSQKLLTVIWKYQIMYNTVLTLDRLKERSEIE